MEKFGCNPYTIVLVGKTKFARTMKKYVPRIRKDSIEKLFNQAQTSVRHGLSERHIDILERRLIQLWTEYLIYEGRKNEARQEMEALYLEARKEDRRLPQAEKGVITTFHLARIVAETGPLSDFASWRKLMRFAGLNLRERQSGKYRGKTKIAKKGRGGLRKVLSQVVLPLVTRKGLYGEYYHRKKEEAKMPGTKAMTIIMRKFLKMFFGWYQSGNTFNRDRVFTCESRYQLAA
jgi:transposase